MLLLILSWKSSIITKKDCIGFGTVPVDNSTQSSKVIIIKCSHFAGFHGFNNRQRLHREYLFFKIFLVCPFHPCFVLLSRYWLCFDLRDYLSITINNGLPIWSLEPSCGIFFHVSKFYWVSVKLSLPAPLPPCFRKSVHNQIILQTNSILPPIINIASLRFLTWI